MIIRSSINESIYFDILKEVNKEFDNNIVLRNFLSHGKKDIILSLRVKNSKKQGSRINAEGRGIASACYHVYLSFLRKLYEIDPKAKVRTALATFNDYSDFIYKYKAVGEKIVFKQPYKNLCRCNNRKIIIFE